MRNRRSAIFLCLIAVSMAGCVWEPVDQSTQSRTAPFDVRGWAAAPGSTITVEALNYATGSYDVIGAMTTTSSSLQNWTNPSLYHYATPSVTLDSNYWVPPGAGCETGGMANLRVFENSARLNTFDQAEKDCVSDEVWNGAHPVNAAQDCGYSNTLVLFSPPTC